MLQELDVSVFSPVSQLTSLHLQHNRLTNLHSSLLAGLHRLTELSLEGNLLTR